MHVKSTCLCVHEAKRLRLSVCIMCVSGYMSACMMAHTCVWASLCVNPQRYFNFCWILKKRAVAAALGLPAGEFRGALWPWLRGGDEGEVAHGQGPCRTHWRLFLEDFRTTTLLHQNPANPNHSLQHPSTSLSLSLAHSELSLKLFSYQILISLNICLCSFLLMRCALSFQQIQCCNQRSLVQL